MNDARCLLQEFHTLVSEYSDRLPMTKMYRDSVIRRIEAELETPRPEAGEKNVPLIRGVGLVKMFKEQRDESADVLRRLMHKLREESGSEDPMEPFAYDASWEALANEADAVLAKCPSYTQQLNNLLDGLGITREQLDASLEAHATRSPRLGKNP